MGKDWLTWAPEQELMRGGLREKKGKMAKAAARVRKSWKDPAATLISRVLGT